MITRSRLLVGLLLALSVLFTLYKVPIASSQGLTIVAAAVEGDLPATDVDSPMWQEAAAIEVPMSAQVVAKPILPDTKIRSVTARALHNGSQLAILVEWKDETLDDQMVRVQDFRDSVALQFPLLEGQPFFCMGQTGGNVNIWHWKADWQSDITRRQDMETLYPDMYVDHFPFADPAAGVGAGPEDYLDANYLPALASGNLFASGAHASPVEDLIAGGFGTLTSQPVEGQNVQGFGVWENGLWRVIFLRGLASPEPDDVSFTPGNLYPLAFAAWDGANAERDGLKSTSQWVDLQLAGEAPRPEVDAGAAPRPEGEVVVAPPRVPEGIIFVALPMVACLLPILLLLIGVVAIGIVIERRR